MAIWWSDCQRISTSRAERMIRYRLECPKGHDFDGWFRNSGAFDDQATRGLLECPDCGSKKIRKAIMAPSVAIREEMPAPVATVPAGEDPKVAAVRAEILNAMRELRRKVEESAEYVGPRFAEEARRIHYEEAEEHGIYGEASVADVKALTEEGIEIHPLPVLPEDRN